MDNGAPSHTRIGLTCLRALLVVALAAAPRAFAPEPLIGGLFSSAAGGLMTVMGSLVGHAIYGSVLGSIASAPVGTRVAHA